MLWRFSANHTHLYPGALLRCLDTPGEARLSAGDELLVEFSDGLLEAQADGAVLQMPAHRTRRATTVAARTWRITPGGTPGLVRIHRRIAS
jgi:hypothetical protein